MYGFRHLSKSSSENLSSSSYYHPNFSRDRQDLLQTIQRLVFKEKQSSKRKLSDEISDIQDFCKKTNSFKMQPLVSSSSFGTATATLSSSNEPLNALELEMINKILSDTYANSDLDQMRNGNMISMSNNSICGMSVMNNYNIEAEDISRQSSFVSLNHNTGYFSR